MEWFDAKFRTAKRAYVFQCLLVAVFIGALLLVLDVRQDAAVLGSLAASAFIAFTLPHKRVSRPRILAGGYLVAVAAAFLAQRCWALLPLELVQGGAYVAFVAVTAGLTAFLMAVTECEHPPAVGLALGLFIEGCRRRAVVVALACIVALVLVQRLLRPRLKDLA